MPHWLNSPSAYKPIDIDSTGGMMTKKTVQSGDDGAVDHHGDVLPPLSKSASQIDVAKIERRRRHASNPGEHPGVSWFYNMVRGLCRMALKQQFRTIEVTGQENI